MVRNWITLIVQKKGHWGGSKTAQVEECLPFRRGERPLGYFCPVEPQFALECLLAHPDSWPLIATATDVNLHTWASPRMPENPRPIKGGLTPFILLCEEILKRRRKLMDQ